MDKCNTFEMLNPANFDQKYFNTLDMKSFFLMLKDPSYCYKFYWLEAIVNLINEGKFKVTFDEIIDEMISNAWYTVVEYHVHLSGYMLGEIRDSLERAVNTLHLFSDIPSNASKIDIKKEIQKYNDVLRKDKEQLIVNVPYRALSAFFNSTNQKINWNNTKQMVESIKIINERFIRLPYTLGNSSKLDREVFFDNDWIEMINDNSVNILGWIQFEKIKWLQSNNPEVPALVYKLVPLNDKLRKLSRAHKLWDMIMDNHVVRDVFTEEELNHNSYDIDHFVPWSYVMNDELWNLMPMNPSLNSSKSNKLPKWEPFFKRFADNQFILYELIHSNQEIHNLFNSCYKDNLHSLWAIQELYNKGNNKDVFINILDKNIQPLYDAASRQGYSVWDY